MIEDEEGLVAVATSYFRDLFEMSTQTKIDEALGHISSTFSAAINQALIARVTEWEVKLALFSMHL